MLSAVSFTSNSSESVRDLGVGNIMNEKSNRHLVKGSTI